MRRVALLVLATLAVALVGSPAATGSSAAGGLHGYHLSLQPQATADGTVVVETLDALEPVFVVLETDDRSERVGAAYVERPGSRTDVPVRVDADAWDDWTGNATLRAVLHRDDGDGEFDPGSDPAVGERYPAARSEAPIGKASAGDTRVLAGQFDPLPVENGTVSVRRVDLAADGHVVVRPFDGGDPLGARTLPAGIHHNVTVEVDESVVAGRTGSVSVRIAVHRDDGDGTFDGTEPPVTVGDTPVGTVARLTADADRGEVVINTPADMTTPAGDPDSVDDPGPSPTGGSAGSGPGFGAVATGVALLAVVPLVRRRG